MRAVFVGAGALAVMTARFLLRRRHEVVIVERDKGRIDALSSELDCGFLHGDGSKPALLREADPAHTDFLFCISGDDQTNIIASLVGRSLGFARVVTKIDDPEFEHICLELGLEDMIIPSRTIGRYLADLFQGVNFLDLSGIIKDDARIFTFVAHENDEAALHDLKLPSQSRVMCLYRGGKFVAVEEDTHVKADDEVVIVTHAKNMDDLHARWGVQPEPSHEH